jgi:YbgC/YbaW family acyl-CoA thioester hydrolase
MAYEFKLHKTVEFSDTDMAGIMHFANFFRYMEFAEHAFFRSLGLKLHTNTETGIRGWARGNAECTFRQPLRYEDVVEIHVLVAEKRSKSLSYLIVFRKQEPNTIGGLIEVARGSLTVICVSKAQGESAFRAATMPPEVNAKIDVAPPELLK